MIWLRSLLPYRMSLWWHIEILVHLRFSIMKSLEFVCHNDILLHIGHPFHFSAWYFWSLFPHVRSLRAFIWLNILCAKKAGLLVRKILTLRPVLLEIDRSIMIAYLILKILNFIWKLALQNRLPSLKIWNSLVAILSWVLWLPWMNRTFPWVTSWNDTKFFLIGRCVLYPGFRAATFQMKRKVLVWCFRSYPRLFQGLVLFYFVIIKTCDSLPVLLYFGIIPI